MRFRKNTGNNFPLALFINNRLLAFDYVCNSQNADVFLKQNIPLTYCMGERGEGGCGVGVLKSKSTFY